MALFPRPMTCSQILITGSLSSFSSHFLKFAPRDYVSSLPYSSVRTLENIIRSKFLEVCKCLYQLCPSTLSYKISNPILFNHVKANYWGVGDLHSPLPYCQWRGTVPLALFSCLSHHSDAFKRESIRYLRGFNWYHYSDLLFLKSTHTRMHTHTAISTASSWLCMPRRLIS